MATCSRCRRRAAKRFCPALDAKICSVCCARDRMLELECPEECQYLTSGRLQSMEREQQLVTRELAALGKGPPVLGEKASECLAAARWVVVDLQRKVFSDLQDAEILAALENAIRNLETESAGIIYEHPEYSMRIQEVSRRVRKTLEDLFSDEPAEFRPRTSDILEALKGLRDNVELHTRRGDPRSFIRYTAQFFPWRQPKPTELIVTG